VKILLFGGSGQLGYELKKRASDLAFELVSPVTAELDITDREQVKFLTASVNPDVVINSAAYTAVDKAETEIERAFAVNRDGARNIAEACEAIRCRLIHISTDYVFDGMLGRPLREDDPVNAVSVYGKSKLEGEEAVIGILGDKALIARTQALYGQKGVNFVFTMLKLFPERDVLKIVSDQWVSPTWAGWLAEALLDFARIDRGGVVHASCAGAVSWFDFASEIMTLARPHFRGAKLALLEATTADELNRPARRPVYSAFDTSAITALLGRAPISWQEGLRIFLREIGVLE
jgi:dTDP-4-dehydrorhamnose reductase